jgi:hypothetical protein
MWKKTCDRKQNFEKSGIFKCIVLVCNFATSTRFSSLSWGIRFPGRGLSKVPPFRGCAISIAHVGCAMVNADRDIVQQETALALSWCPCSATLYLCTYRDLIVWWNFEFMSVSFHFPFLLFPSRSPTTFRANWTWFGTCEYKTVAKEIPNRSANRGGSNARPSVLLCFLLQSRFEKVAFLCP